MDTKFNEKELRKAANLLLWNKCVLSVIGLWPESPRIHWFIICSIYLL